MSSDGREQVTNFFMAGEMIGLDGISSNVYSCDVVALEDAECASSRFRPHRTGDDHDPTMGKHFQKLLSREIVRQHGVMLLLGSMHAEERLPPSSCRSPSASKTAATPAASSCCA